MVLLAGGDIASYAALFEGGEVGFGAVVRIGRDLLRVPPGESSDLLQRWDELTAVGGRVGQPVGDDDLAVRIHRSLGVVALLEAGNVNGSPDLLFEHPAIVRRAALRRLEHREAGVLQVAIAPA